MPSRSARLFYSTCAVALQAANTAGGKRRARNRQRHRCGKQHCHHSKQSQTALHEPVPRLALICAVYPPRSGMMTPPIANSGLRVPCSPRGRAGESEGLDGHGVKVKNPNAPAVKREAEEDWGSPHWIRSKSRTRRRKPCGSSYSKQVPCW